MDLPRVWHMPDAGAPPPSPPRAAHAAAIALFVLCVLIIVLSTTATWTVDDGHPAGRRRSYAWGPVPVAVVIAGVVFLYDDQVVQRRRIEHLTRTWYAPTPEVSPSASPGKAQ